MSSCSRHSTEPDVGSASPDKISSNVLLPEPLGPIIRPSFWGAKSRLIDLRIAVEEAVG